MDSSFPWHLVEYGKDSCTVLFTKLKENNNEYGYISKGDTIVVAVSGGPDSVALLHSLYKLKDQWDIKLIAAHLDHGFRGEESKADAEYVKKLALSLSIPSEITAVDVLLYMKEKAVGAQQAAREVRYTFLANTAKKYDAHIIATAHHLNDQAETLVLRLLRGTSLSGLSGIPLKRTIEGVTIVRPFLPSISRQDIEQYIEEYELHPRSDKSNDSLKYLRNRVRIEFLPKWREINPKVDEHLGYLAEMARAENEYLDRIVMGELELCITSKEKGRIEINRRKFQTVDVALQRRMIKLILSDLTLSDEVSYVHIEEIRLLLLDNNPSATRSLFNPFYVFNDYDQTVFTTNKNASFTPFQIAVQVPGTTIVEERQKKLHAIITDERMEAIPNNSDWAVFDGDCFDLKAGEVRVRSRLPGDRMNILGLSGSKKVKDILIDDKVSRHVRHAYSVLCYKDAIIWIPGLRRSDFAKVHEATKQYIYFFMEDL